MLLQAIVCRLPYSVLCLLATLQVWQVRTSRTPAITQSIVTVTAKYTPKAKPPSSAQLLLCAVGRNRAKYRLHQPAFQGCPAKSSSLSQPPSNHFRNPTAAYLYGSQVTAFAPFFGSPDASSHTYYVTATVKHENPPQRNPSDHPGKLLKPSHFPVDMYL
jgi:hypothetical protein